MKSIQLMKQNIKLMNILMQPGNENWTWQDLIGNDGGALRASLDVWESQLFEGVFFGRCVDPRHSNIQIHQVS